MTTVNDKNSNSQRRTAKLIHDRSSRSARHTPHRLGAYKLLFSGTFTCALTKSLLDGSIALFTALLRSPILLKFFDTLCINFFQFGAVSHNPAQNPFGVKGWIPISLDTLESTLPWPLFSRPFAVSVISGGQVMPNRWAKGETWHLSPCHVIVIIQLFAHELWLFPKPFDSPNHCDMPYTSGNIENPTWPLQFNNSEARALFEQQAGLPTSPCVAC